MAPHSSTLAWKIPWTEEPGGLQSMGSLRVGHDWATSLSLSLPCIGEGNDNPLQCSCLENPRDGGAWWAALYGVAQSRTRLKRLSSSSCWALEQSRLFLTSLSTSAGNLKLPGVPQVNVLPLQIYLHWLQLFAFSHWRKDDSLPVYCDPMDYSLTRLLCPWDSPGKNTGVGCRALLQGSSQPKDRTPILCSSCTAGRFFTSEPWRKHIIFQAHPILSYS